MFGDWVSANASGSGYKVEVNNNIFASTRKGNYPGTASGYALADCPEGTKLQLQETDSGITNTETCTK